MGELPVKAPKKARRVEKRAVWLIFWENRVALRRRPDKGLLAGLWEFPNELGDGPLPPDWGIGACSEEYGGQAKHIFTHMEWRMAIRLVRAASGVLPPGWVWAAADELEKTYAVPNAFQRAVELAGEHLRGMD